MEKSSNYGKEQRVFLQPAIFIGLRWIEDLPRRDRVAMGGCFPDSSLYGVVWLITHRNPAWLGRGEVDLLG